MRGPRERPERERPEGGVAAAPLPSSGFHRPESRVLVALAAGLITGVLAWVVLSYHGWTRHAATTSATTTQASVKAVGPEGLDVTGLRTQAAALGQPVYWLGPEGGVRYELKRTGDGSVFLRYLPHGVAVGAAGPYRTVGTYPFPGAYAAVHGLAQQADTVWFDVRGGGIAVYRRIRPTNVYVAWPGFDYEIEVYDAQSGQARRLASSPALRRMAGT